MRFRRVEGARDDRGEGCGWEEGSQEVRYWTTFFPPALVRFILGGGRFFFLSLSLSVCVLDGWMLYVYLLLSSSPFPPPGKITCLRRKRKILGRPTRNSAYKAPSSPLSHLDILPVPPGPAAAPAAASPRSRWRGWSPWRLLGPGRGGRGCALGCRLWAEWRGIVFFLTPF